MKTKKNIETKFICLQSNRRDVEDRKKRADDRNKKKTESKAE